MQVSLAWKDKETPKGTIKVIDFDTLKLAESYYKENLRGKVIYAKIVRFGEWHWYTYKVLYREE